MHFIATRLNNDGGGGGVVGSFRRSRIMFVKVSFRNNARATATGRIVYFSVADIYLFIKYTSCHIHRIYVSDSDEKLVTPQSTSCAQINQL